MIHFVEAQSIYFERNKAFCEFIQNQFPNFVFEGECSSFGYDFSAESKEYSRTKFQFKKAQYGGRISTHYNYEFRISTFINHKNVELSFEKSSIKRILMSADLKKLISKPYYVNSNFTNEKTVEFYNFILKENIDSVEIKDGEIEIKLLRKTENPMKILNFFLERINS